MSFLNKSLHWLLPVLFTCAITVKAEAQAPQLGKNSVKEVIGAMTLEEKVTLLVGSGKAPKPKAAGDGVSNGWVPEPPMIGHTETKVPGAAGNTNAIERLGIPSLVLSDGPAGVRISPTRKDDPSKTYYATAFPVGTLLASTWDPELVESVGKAFGNEVKEYGVDILLAPGVNIHRNPLNGRNFEYYSEDPLVAGKTAAAIIRGVQSNGVGTSIKHFVANNEESNRNYVSSTVSERALREIYLRQFRIAIAESDPWTVMSSYNRVNGRYTAQREDLLTTVLRDEWKFGGFVMSDWGGGYDWIEEMKAGNDLIMPGRPDQIATLISAVQHDSLSMKILDRNVEHLLNIILKSPSFNHYNYSNAPDLKAHAEVARKAASEGMILLKNQNKALPIDKTIKTIAAFGPASYQTIPGGTGSGAVNKAYVISIYDGFKNAGYTLDKSLQVIDKTTPPPTSSLISAAAAKDDIAIITIGRNSGEGHDRNLENNYNLTSEEKQQFNAIAAAFHTQGKKVVAVLNIGGVIDMNGWQENADAILLAWQPGQEAGNAIADVLTGKVNPSGKLATTFPAKYEDVPSAKNFPGTPADHPAQVLYEEGIYVGYRYYDSFHIKPAYEFGYGLSYTDFSLNHLTLSTTDFKEKLTATLSVKNTGKTAGKEVVQIYINAPAKYIDKPEQELKAFAKTRLLQPGEEQVLTFEIAASDLASYYTKTSEWIADTGTYTLKAGISSRDIRQQATFKVTKAIIVEKDHKVLQPDVDLEEIKARR
jgi:beta-glucosidase